jgi:hypothetical protein
MHYYKKCSKSGALVRSLVCNIYDDNIEENVGLKMKL